jgi:protein-disulfide isomerase/uncharacterized membrane protein
MDAPLPAAAPRFQQPRPLVRWLAVLLAAAGWYMSLELLQVAGGVAVRGTVLEALCGGGSEGQGLDDCSSVLASPHAYVPLSPDPNAPKLPAAAFGLAYFAFIFVWYVFVGPPTRAGRGWHWLILLHMLGGVAQSASYINIMANELHRWCAGCLVVHTINGLLLVLTLIAYPWRRPAVAPPAHPSTRLALATTVAGSFAGATFLVIALMMMATTMYNERSKRFEEVLSDPAYILWDYNRQVSAAIPLYDDEAWGGPADAANTVIVFGDFQCSHCRDLHNVLQQVAAKYADRVRVGFRYFPQDPECNADPRYRAGGHASACRAARAAEAARQVGGREKYLAMRSLLWEHQAELPNRPFAQQSAAEKKCFEDWAATLGLDRAAFAAAMDSPTVNERLAADIALAERLDARAMPVVYVNGKRLRNWSQLATWDAVLGGVAP